MVHVFTLWISVFNNHFSHFSNCHSKFNNSCRFFRLDAKRGEILMWNICKQTPQTWILGCLVLYKANSALITSIKYSMWLWKTNLEVNSKVTTQILMVICLMILEHGMYQGDVHCPCSSSAYAWTPSNRSTQRVDMGTGSEVERQSATSYTWITSSCTCKSQDIATLIHLTRIYSSQNEEVDLPEG